MGLPDADTLVIAGSSKSQEIEALKAIYGTGATVRVATSGDDIIGILTSYSTIKRLVIGTHGSQGDVIIRGTHIPIGRLAASLRSARVRPRVTDVVIFDGCNVAGESESLVSFLEALLAPRLQAFAESHLWWSDEYMFGKGADANAMEPLRRQYESNRDYLVAGQPTWPAMVKRGGRIRIWYEGFSCTLREAEERHGKANGRPAFQAGDGAFQEEGCRELG